MPSTDTDLRSSPDIVTLRDAHSTLALAPSAGGRLMQWRVDGKPVIHWPATFDLANASHIRGGNPLLFPFIGRHRVGTTPNQWQDANGEVYALPQHGFARELPFEYASSDDGQAISMTLSSSPLTRSGYPFEFTFQASYRLVSSDVADDTADEAAPRGRSAALEVTLETRNTGDRPLPYYAGHHFYLDLPRALRAESCIHLPPTLLCEQLADGSISAPLPEPDSYAPGDPAIQDRFHLLNNDRKEGKPARVTLDTPSLGRRISIALDRPESIPWYALTTWTESDDADFYCIEPWLGLPNAIHHGQGLRWVAPGESETARCRIVVEFKNTPPATLR